MSDMSPQVPDPGDPVPPGHVPLSSEDDPGAWSPPPQPGAAWPPPDPSSWPPPDQPATSAWGSQPAVIEASYGPGAGGPPPPSGNQALKITLILVAVVVVIGGVLAAGVITWNAVSDTVGTDASPTPTQRETDEVPVNRDDPSDVALDSVLTFIDESELTMIQFQVEVEQAASDEAVRQAGSTAATNLRRLDEELSDTDVSGAYADAVRAVRDSYLEHLRAWTTYVEATAENAEAFLDPSGDYWLDITDTADVFVAAVEDDLPEDIPDDLARFADFILDRGFRQTDEPDGTLV